MKFRFGLRELFFVIIGVCVNAVLEGLKLDDKIYFYEAAIQPESIVTAFLAMLGGPIVGALVGFLGYIVASLLSHQIYYWGWAAANMVVGLGIGLYADRYYLPDGDFRGQKLIVFNLIQIIANGCAYLLVYPLSEVFLYANPVERSLQTGIEMFVVSSCVIGVGATLIGILYSTCVNVKKKNVKKQK